MKIAYVAFAPASGESGVLKKIVFQLRAWRDAGHDVSLFTLGRGSERWAGAADIALRTYEGRGTASWFLQAERLVSDVISLRPDVVYHRFGVHLPALERLLAKTAVVVELNSLDVSEYRHSLSRLRFAYHLATRGRIFRRARGLVAVTHEIARSVSEFRLPTLVLGNGIDLSAIEPVAATTGGRPSVVFIAANPHEPWHGFDKLLVLARALPSHDFHVVGGASDKLGVLPPNVIGHGFLEHVRYRAVATGADIGVGPLALHRKHMNEACPLKTREYLAMGLPVIAGHRDPDFPNGAPFLLELENREDNVEPALATLREFIARWQHNRIDRAQIMHLDTRQKEPERLAFLSTVAGAETGKRASTAR